MTMMTATERLRLTLLGTLGLLLGLVLLSGWAAIHTLSFSLGTEGRVRVRRTFGLQISLQRRRGRVNHPSELTVFLKQRAQILTGGAGDRKSL